MQWTDREAIAAKRPKYDFGRSWWDYPWDEFKSDAVDGFFTGVTPWAYEQTKIWCTIIVFVYVIDAAIYEGFEESWYKTQRDKLVRFLKTDDFEFLFLQISVLPQWIYMDYHYTVLGDEPDYYLKYQKFYVFKEIPMAQRVWYHWYINYWDWYLCTAVFRHVDFHSVGQTHHTLMRSFVKTYPSFWNLIWPGTLRPPRIKYYKSKLYKKYIHPFYFNIEEEYDYTMIEIPFFDHVIWWIIRHLIGNQRTWWGYYRQRINFLRIIAPYYVPGEWYPAAYTGRGYRDFRRAPEEVLYQRRKMFALWDRSYYLEDVYVHGRYLNRFLFLEHPDHAYWAFLWDWADLYPKLHTIIDNIHSEAEILLNLYQPDYFAIMNELEYEVYYDAPVSRQMGFQDPATPIMEGIIDLHHDLFFFMIIIFVFVLWLLVRLIYFFSIRNNDMHKPIRFTHHTTLEIVWTIVPSLILIAIAIPSFALVYAMDEIVNPSVTIKVIGHQWYWSYEYSDYGLLEEDQILFDSYMLAEDDLNEGFLRLLDVDNRVVLPARIHVRLLITSADVIHSWAVPSFGVKLDACPGRLNQIAIFVKRPGVFYGQCSEICGVNHGFMPIAVEAVELEQYFDWLSVRLAIFEAPAPVVTTERTLTAAELVGTTAKLDKAGEII